MRIHVAIATTGRPDVLCKVVDRFKHQTRLPDGIVVVGASPDDIAGVDALDMAPEHAVVSPKKGLCCQRNVALSLLRGKTDAVVFFDDDFVVAHDFLERLEALFVADPKLVGLTGWLIADGAQTGALSYEEAEAMLDAGAPRPARPDERTSWLYGCNMAFRMSACEGLSFDENLPLYGWQEDVDFTEQLARRGHMLRTNAITGIHMGTRGGRTSGLKLGYSQVANIVYLRRKGTIGAVHGWALMARNVAANLAKSIRPEPLVDRRGRLKGNIRAFGDVLRGRADPLRILDL
ncbi:glycosyltransferase family 2 protein [Croceicoccus sp. Ery15]|uniref:glycosyltransferase family 2 protein n=1 Tax=Croceicoccus sp. Ery15 TaxID=1703338 RepID=UPI001E4892A5|nr:glycosyltransferase [Croceicoccus sp. Ery15]